MFEGSEFKVQFQKSAHDRGEQSRVKRRAAGLYSVDGGRETFQRFKQHEAAAKVTGNPNHSGPERHFPIAFDVLRTPFQPQTCPTPYTGLAKGRNGWINAAIAEKRALASREKEKGRTTGPAFSHTPH